MKHSINRWKKNTILLGLTSLLLGISLLGCDKDDSSSPNGVPSAEQLAAKKEMEEYTNTYGKIVDAISSLRVEKWTQNGMWKIRLNESCWFDGYTNPNKAEEFRGHGNLTSDRNCNSATVQSELKSGQTELTINNLIAPTIPLKLVIVKKDIQLTNVRGLNEPVPSNGANSWQTSQVYPTYYSNQSGHLLLTKLTVSLKHNQIERNDLSVTLKDSQSLNSGQNLVQLYSIWSTNSDEPLQFGIAATASLKSGKYWQTVAGFGNLWQYDAQVVKVQSPITQALFQENANSIFDSEIRLDTDVEDVGVIFGFSSQE